MKCPYCDCDDFTLEERESQKRHLIKKHRTELVKILITQKRDVDDWNIAQAAGTVAFLVS